MTDADWLRALADDGITEPRQYLADNLDAEDAARLRRIAALLDCDGTAFTTKEPSP